MRIPRKSSLLPSRYDPCGCRTGSLHGSPVFLLFSRLAQRAGGDAGRPAGDGSARGGRSRHRPSREKLPPLPLEAGQTIRFCSGARKPARSLSPWETIPIFALRPRPKPADCESISSSSGTSINNVIRIEGLKEPPTEPAALASLRLEPGRAFPGKFAPRSSRSARSRRFTTKGCTKRKSPGL